MLALVLREAGLDPSFIVGGDVNGLGTGAVWDDGEWFVVEADESDGTFLELGRRGRGRHQRRGRPPRPLGRLRRAARRPSRGSSPRRPGPGSCAPTTPGGRRRRRTVGGCVTYGTAADADYRMVDVRHRSGRRRRSRSTRRRGARPLDARRCPGCTTPATPPPRSVTALALGADPSAVRRGAGRLRRRGPALRAPGRGGRGHLRRRLRPPARPRCAAVLAAAREPAAGARVVCVFQPHRYTRTPRPVARLRRRLRRRRRARRHRHLRRPGSSRSPGVTGKLVVDAVLDAHPRRRVAWLPRRGRPARRGSPAELRPATCASRSAPATSPRCPTSCSPPSGPAGVTARTAAVERRRPSSSATGPGRRAARRRSRPTGSAGRPRLLRRGRRRRRPGRAGRRASGPSGRRRAGGRARARTCSWPTPASPGWPSCSATAFADGRRSTAPTGAGRAAPPPCPVLARRTAAAGLTGLEWAVGVPGLGRRRRAHERRRPRLRHGRHPA